MSTEKLYIFDTTMRDGNQSALAKDMGIKAKVQLGRQLNALGVDIIEAGMPVSSREEHDAVKRVAREVPGSIIAGLARALPNDIESAWDALKSAQDPRIHVFLSTSDIHLMHQMKKSREEIMEMAVAGVKYARNLCGDVEFSPMDATRTDPVYLYELLEKVIQAGATTINIPDSVGYALPSQFKTLITGIFQNVPSLDPTKIRLSVHCHNDLGGAWANTIAGIEAGARQVEGCINGIGERAGNVALEEIIATVHTRGDNLGVHTDIDTKQIMRTSALTSKITGLKVQANKAVIGAQAFAHESGIHQDAVLKHLKTFEILDKGEFGIDEELQIRVGRNSGTGGIIHVAKRVLDIDLTRAEAYAIRTLIVDGRHRGKITTQILHEMVEQVRM